MKKLLAIAALSLTATFANAQSTATNWTAQDCSNNSHTLFTDLDAGKIVVMVWVMPCPSCVAGATAAYKAMQSFATSHPGKVVYYIADDLGDATCTDLNTWITGNSIGATANMSIFSNSGNPIKESNFGGSGMPHVAVMGGTDHKIYYNKMNGATNDQSGITNAINSALSAVSVANVQAQLKFAVSPNPAAQQVTITNAQPVQQVTITTLNGQVIKNETFANGKADPVINLSGVAAGVYSVKVTDITGASGVQKLVKE